MSNLRGFDTNPSVDDIRTLVSYTNYMLLAVLHNCLYIIKIELMYNKAKNGRVDKFPFRPS